jgi:hypothetical protein
MKITVSNKSELAQGIIAKKPWAPGTTQSWAPSVAGTLFRCLVPAQIAYDAMMAHVGDKNLNEDREFDIRRAVERKYKGQLGEHTESISKWPEPDIAEVERIVADSTQTVANLTGSSTNQVGNYSLNRILEAITYPRQLVCYGISREAANVAPIETILKNPHKVNFQFVVPNPMRKRTGAVIGLDGKPYESGRCKDNASLADDRRFTVVEFDFAKHDKEGKPTIWKPSIERWETAGITVKDAAVRLLFHLLKSYHLNGLVMVVDSGGKSLHSWINARTCADLVAFELEAVRPGADWHTFLPWQWVRFPGGTRRNEKGTAPQPVLYINPNNAPKLGETKRAQELT